MNWPELSDFRELRRALPVVAAVLFVAALAFPMWHIHIQAVQYPDTVLHLKMYAYPRLSGDFAEIHRLNKYIGFYYPDPVFWQPNYTPDPYAIDVPEWSLGPFAFVAVSLLSVFVAIAPTVEKLKRGLLWQLVGTITVFGVMLVDIQYRLWQAGHHLDPGAPVMGVDGFTPPIWGLYKVANITSFSHFGPGVFMAGAAAAMLVVAFYYRDSTATFGELPGRVAGGIPGLPGRIRDRLSRGESQDDSENHPPEAPVEGGGD